MSQWIDANIPDDTDAYYWITVIKNITLSQPFQYNKETDNWISFSGEIWSKDAVISYYKIPKPKQRATVGNGMGFYIKTYYYNDEFIYGKGLQPANWCMKGYETVEKAITAIKRLKKLDIADGYKRDKYEVIDGTGNFVKEVI